MIDRLHTLTQLRLGSKLPSLHIPLPQGRGEQGMKKQWIMK